MNGSVVTPKIAGIESSAKTRSVSSITISTRNSSVKRNRPSSRTMKRLEFVSALSGSERRASRTTRPSSTGRCFRGRTRLTPA